MSKNDFGDTTTIDSKVDFCRGFNEVQEDIHDIAIAHGWWDSSRSDGEVIALCHSELSEALEAMREGNPSSEKIPDFTKVEEELADVIIRIMDFAGKEHLSIAEAMLAKIEYNRTRPYKHGGKKF